MQILIRKILAFDRLTAWLWVLHTVLFWSAVLMLMLYSRLHWAWCSLGILAAGAAGGVFLRKLAQGRRDWKEYTRDLEQTVFKQRTLIADSLYEAGPQVLRLGLEGVQEDLESSPSFQVWSRKLTLSRRRRLAAAVLGLAVWLLSMGVLKNPVSQEAARFRAYLLYHPGTLPAWYLEGQPLPLDFSAFPERSFSLRVEAAGMSWETDTQRLVLPAEVTGQESLDLTVYVVYRGIEREVTHQSLSAIREFLLLSSSLEVVYPFRRDKYASLQDLEIWQGARVLLSGEMNHTIRDIQTDPQGGSSEDFQGSHFQVSFQPGTGGIYRISLMSVSTQWSTLPPFGIRILPNYAPVLRLLYPLQDIRLDAYRWDVRSLLEAEDEQGLDRLTVRITVSNRDPALGMPSREQFTRLLDARYFTRLEWQTGSSQLELLPGDVAAVHFQVRDVLGLQSEPVGFYILSPDIWDIRDQTRQLQEGMREDSRQIKNSLEKLEQDIRSENISGADQKARDIGQDTASLQESVQELGRVLSQAREEIEDISRSLKRMEEISRQLSEYSEVLQNMQEYLEKPSAPPAGEISKNMEQLLTEFEAMLKNLEYYQKYSDLLQQYRDLEQVYEGLKQQSEGEDFSRYQQHFQQNLEKMQQLAMENIQETLLSLERESLQFRPQNQDTFKAADQLMQDLKKSIREQVQDVASQRLQARRESLDRVLHELYLQQYVLTDIRSLDPGSGPYDQTVLTEWVRSLNAIQVSYNELTSWLEDALSGLMFTDSEQESRLSSLQMSLQDTLQSTVTGLRDHRVQEVRQNLDRLSGQVSALFWVVLQLDQALEKLPDSRQGQSPGSMLSMEQLMQMQGGMSSALQQLMKQLQAQGGITPAQQKMMEQLARLQNEIARNLSRALQGEGRLLSEGQQTMSLMEDIVKDLESYRVEAQTLEKSRQVEEKLLKSQKSLQSKGISEKRQAEKARSYEPEPGQALDLQTPLLELEKMQKEGLSDYYLRLAEKYRQNGNQESREQQD